MAKHAEHAEETLPPEPDERPQRRREWTGPLRSVVLPLLAVAVIVLAVWYLQAGRGSGGARPASGTGIVPLPAAKNPTGKPPSTEIGRAAPDFVLQKLGGGTLRLSDLQGKTVLINFWATWCGPCREEMPHLVKVYDQYKDQGFIVLSVDEQEDANTVQKFVDQYGMRFPVVLDTSGQVGETFHAGTQFPTSIFLNPDGTVRAIRNDDGTTSAIHYGPMNEAFILRQLDVQTAATATPASEAR